MSDDWKELKKITITVSECGEGENRKVAVHSDVEETSLEDLMKILARATLNHILAYEELDEAAFDLWFLVSYALVQFNLQLDDAAYRYTKEYVEIIS